MMGLETIVLQVTTKCPHHCPQCYMQRGNDDMPISIAKRVVQDALENGAKAVQITGGEPMCYPYLQELVRFAKEKDMYAFLATSGYGHSYESYSELKECGLTVVCVSINDIEEEHNKTTRDSFAESLSAMRTAKECGLSCMANVVVTDNNMERLSVLGEYLKARDVEAVCLLRPTSSFDGRYVPRLSPSTVQKMHKIVSEDPAFFFVENCFKEYREYVTGQPFVCRDIGKRELFVCVDGKISPCSKLQQYKFSSMSDMLEHGATWERGCEG